MILLSVEILTEDAESSLARFTGEFSALIRREIKEFEKEKDKDKKY